MKLDDFLIQLVKYCNCRIDLNFKTASKKNILGNIAIVLRNDENIISSISVTDIVFDYYLDK